MLMNTVYIFLLNFKMKIKWKKQNLSQEEFSC